MGAANALNSLRVIGRSLHAWVLPHQVAVPQGWKVFDDDGTLKDENLRARLLDVGRQVTRFTYLHTNEKVQEFLQLWEEAIPNPGG